MEIDVITSKLKMIISEIKEDETLVSSINHNDDLINEVGLDSLEMIDFMLQIEEAFSVQLDFDKIDFSDLKSIKSLAEFLSGQYKSNGKVA